MKTLLVVDDNLTNRWVVKRLCKHLDLRCVEAASGARAVELLLEHKVPCDIILLDLHMPHLTGLQTLHRLVNSPYWRPVPVVAYSAHTQDADWSLLAAAGFTHRLDKPISLAGFEALLKACQVR